jgi:hypothetical protein
MIDQQLKSAGAAKKRDASGNPPERAPKKPTIETGAAPGNRKAETATERPPRRLGPLLQSRRLQRQSGPQVQSARPQASAIARAQAQFWQVQTMQSQPAERF